MPRYLLMVELKAGPERVCRFLQGSFLGILGRLNHMIEALRTTVFPMGLYLHVALGCPVIRQEYDGYWRFGEAFS